MIAASNMPVFSSLLTAEHVAQLMSCSARHVRRLADAGRMPAPVHLGALVRWPRAVIEAWIGDGCPHPRDWDRGT